MLTLTEADRAAAADAAPPEFNASAAPRESGEEERAHLLETVIAPLLAFSLRQEATIAAERQRAQALVAKVDAFNAAPAVEPRGRGLRLRLFRRD